MSRKHFFGATVIGAAVGLLIQPILANNVPSHDLAYLTPLARIGIFLGFTILAPLALFIAKFLSRWFRGLYQFAQFAAVGTLNSFIDVGVLNLETALYGSSPLSNAAFAGFKAVSFLFGTTNSFFWNKYWTFNATEKANTKEVGGFYGVAIVGWILNVIAATIVKAAGPVDSRTWPNLFAPLAGIAVSFIWNFIGYKYWVFKKQS